MVCTCVLFESCMGMAHELAVIIKKYRILAPRNIHQLVLVVDSLIFLTWKFMNDVEKNANTTNGNHHSVLMFLKLNIITHRIAERRNSWNRICRMEFGPVFNCCWKNFLHSLMSLGRLKFFFQFHLTLSSTLEQRREIGITWNFTKRKLHFSFKLQPTRKTLIIVLKTSKMTKFVRFRAHNRSGGNSGLRRLDGVSHEL